MGGASGPGPAVTVVARCPKGTLAVSGGFTTSVPQVPTHWLAVAESAMTPRGNGWRVSGSEHYATPATDTISAHAYCEKRRRPLLLGGTIRTDFIPNVPGQGTGNAARCPQRMKALSGGFRTSSSQAYFFRSAGSGRNWNVEVMNLGGTFQDIYDVEAYCVRAKVQGLFAPQMAPGPAGAAATALTPGCQKGTLLRGGGFAAKPPTAGLANGALVFDDSLAGRLWSVSAVTTGGMGASCTVFGYCRPR